MKRRSTDLDERAKRERETFARLRALNLRIVSQQNAERERSRATYRRLMTDGIRPDRKRSEPDSVYRRLMHERLRRGRLTVPPLSSDSAEST